jgi:hypothetical protein
MNRVTDSLINIHNKEDFMDALQCKAGKLVTVVLAVVFCSAVFFAAGVVYAEDKAAPAQFNTSSSLEDNLRLFTGKQVTVTLTSGTVYTGKVKAAQNGLLVLEKLTGKSYFDALIRTKKISAIETQVRGF